MSRSNKNNNRRKFSRSEKIFYVLALLIVFSMVVSLVAGALGTAI